jgi:hypothetical protein
MIEQIIVRLDSPYVVMLREARASIDSNLTLFTLYQTWDGTLQLLAQTPQLYSNTLQNAMLSNASFASDLNYVVLWYFPNRLF